jgi:hypothetical protein
MRSLHVDIRGMIILKRNEYIIIVIKGKLITFVTISQKKHYGPCDKNENLGCCH